MAGPLDRCPWSSKPPRWHSKHRGKHRPRYPDLFLVLLVTNRGASRGHFTEEGFLFCHSHFLSTSQDSLQSISEIYGLNSIEVLLAVAAKLKTRVSAETQYLFKMNSANLTLRHLISCDMKCSVSRLTLSHLLSQLLFLFLMGFPSSGGVRRHYMVDTSSGHATPRWSTGG